MHRIGRMALRCARFHSGLLEQDRLNIVESPLADHTRAQRLILWLLLHVALLVVVGPKLRLSQWQVGPDTTQPAAEALAWLDGRLDLTSRGGDVAEFNGKYFVHFPPLFTMICTGVYGLHRGLIGRPEVFWGLLYVLIVAAPIPTLVCAALRCAGQTPVGAAVLTFYMIAGTCLWPVAAMCQRGWIYSIQIVLAQAGLAIFLIDLFGKRRMWLGGIGLMIAAWSRQTTILFAPALLWAAWKSPRRGPALACAIVPLLITAGVPMGLAWAKFGSPFESGYQYIYAGRHDALAEYARGPDGQVQVFGTRYVRHNALHMHLTPPRFDWGMQGVTIQGPEDGVSLWIGSPLLLLALWDARRWWRDPPRRMLMLCSLAVNAALLLYHYTGHDNAGYCRYTLDFTLVWLAVIAPEVFTGWRKSFTAACAGWSVYYFYMVT